MIIPGKKKNWEVEWHSDISKLSSSGAKKKYNGVKISADGEV